MFHVLFILTQFDNFCDIGKNRKQHVKIEITKFNTYIMSINDKIQAVVL